MVRATTATMATMGDGDGGGAGGQALASKREKRGRSSRGPALHVTGRRLLPKAGGARFPPQTCCFPHGRHPASQHARERAAAARAARHSPTPPSTPPADTSRRPRARRRRRLRRRQRARTSPGRPPSSGRAHGLPQTTAALVVHSVLAFTVRAMERPSRLHGSAGASLAGLAVGARCFRSAAQREPLRRVQCSPWAGAPTEVASHPPRC